VPVLVAWTTSAGFLRLLRATPWPSPGKVGTTGTVGGDMGPGDIINSSLYWHDIPLYPTLVSRFTSVAPREGKNAGLGGARFVLLTTSGIGSAAYEVEKLVDVLFVVLALAVVPCLLS
jgi:hypothetical protein